MRTFSAEMTSLKNILSISQTPDFSNLAAVLRSERPKRFTLFEFFFNQTIYDAATADIDYKPGEFMQFFKIADTFCRLGYDYVNMHASDFKFPKNDKNRSGRTVSLNAPPTISDRKSFAAYRWPDPHAFPMTRVDAVKDHVRPGMGMLVYSPGGVEENLIDLVGYDNLCFMLADDPDLVKDIADKIGEALLEYYIICSKHPAVDALIVNDDWGYSKQTLFSPATLREYIFPWHKKIVSVIHERGKPAILHSCGNLGEVMDDIINALDYDAKHSYEDKIMPVEQAYDLCNGQIAVLGGLDVDFVIRSDPRAVYGRACAMLGRSSEKGGYALGTGNSVPDYVPLVNYLAMIAAAILNRQ